MAPRTLSKYARHSSKRRWPLPAISKEEAEAVIDSTLDAARGILIRHLCEFYVKVWDSYRSIPCGDDSASEENIRDVCSGIFEEVKQRVSYRICFHAGFR